METKKKKTRGNLNGMNVISMQNNNFSNAHSSGYDDDDGSVRSSGVDVYLMCWAISFCELGLEGGRLKSKVSMPHRHHTQIDDV